MIKAYDKVDCCFLEDILNRMGLSKIWIYWIMNCVTSVSYNLMVNGKRVGHLQPFRGLRQGDPIASYLFILVVNTLSNMIYKTHLSGQLEGLKIRWSSPFVAHLLFADDALFFLKDIG